jgi:hypothetical protein
MKQGDFTELTPHMVRGLDLMVRGCSITQVALELGVNRTSVWRWTKEPIFAAALAEAQREVLDEARTRIKLLATSAVEALAVTLAEADDPSARIRAATALLDRAGITTQIQASVSVNGNQSLADVLGQLRSVTAELERENDDDDGS